MLAVPGIPEIRKGDRLGSVILAAAREAAIPVEAGDILVIAHKVVSKAEGRIVALRDVTPGPRAVELASQLHKDPRKVELILRESRRVVRAIYREGAQEGILICEHRLGFISANAAVDASNVPGRDMVALLPKDPDASARRIRQEIAEAAGVRPGIVVSDTFGRPWRKGLVNIAIGMAGPAPIVSLVGRMDAVGKQLRVTTPALADELAAAAGLLMPKSANCPVVCIKGLPWEESEGSASQLIRPADLDLFR